MSLNRKVALASAFLTLALAVLPVLADLDWTSTAGVIAGILAVLGVVNRWLAGWSSWETTELRQAGSVPSVAPVEGAKAQGLP